MVTIEERLAKMFKRRYCLMTGNGTSALTIAMRMVAEGKTHILLPAMACYNTVMATYFAGKIPVFADVLESDATIDPKTVKKAICSDPKIGAVLIVHLYGHTAQSEEIIRICHKNNVIAIEDPAQAMGGVYSNGIALGAMGDISILSFGHTKILDVGGGGALLTDDPKFYSNAKKLDSMLPDASENEDMLMGIYQKLYYSIWEAGRKDNRFFSLFDDFPMKFKELFLFKGTNKFNNRINDAMASLERVIKERHDIAQLYRSELSEVDGLDFFHPKKGSVYWRFSFRMEPSIRENVFNRLRGKGIDISGWYPCHTIWTTSGRMQGCHLFPIAKKLEKEVVNLWVAEGYTPQKAIRTIRELKSALANSC